MCRDRVLKHFLLQEVHDSEGRCPNRPDVFDKLFYDPGPWLMDTNGKPPNLINMKTDKNEIKRSKRGKGTQCCDHTDWCTRQHARHSIHQLRSLRRSPVVERDRPS